MLSGFRNELYFGQGDINGILCSKVLLNYQLFCCKQEIRELRIESKFCLLRREPNCVLNSRHISTSLIEISNMNKKLITVALLACLSYENAFAESIDVLAIDYPPYIAEADAENGPLFNLLKKLLETKLPGKSIKPVFLPPARADLLLSQGHFCLSFYPPRHDSDEFIMVPLSNEMVRLGLIRLRQPQPFTWSNLSELKGKSVAMLRPFEGGQVMNRLLNAGFEPVYVESNLQGLRMLSKQRVDYAFGDNKTLSLITVSEDFDENVFQFSDSSIHETIVGINVRKSCELDLN